MAGVGIGASPFLMRRGGGSYEYSPLSEAYFDAMTVQLTVAQKRVIDTAIKATSTQLAKMDYVNIALATEQQSLINLVNPAQSGTKVGSPTFTAYKGFIGDATNRIDTYNPGDGGTYNFLQNNALIGVYVNENLHKATTIDSINQPAPLNAIRHRAAPLGLTGAINGSKDIGHVSLYGIDTGDFISLRRQNGIQHTANIGTAQQTVNASSLDVGNYTLSFKSQLRTAMYFIGGYLTDQELSDFQDAWLPVLEYLGSDYWSNFSDTTLTATPASDSQMDIAWTYPVVTYSPYTIVNAKLWTRETVGTGDWTLLETFTGSETSYEHTGLDNNSYHEYMVTFESSRGITTSEGTVASDYTN